jgi:hypothetical protein
VCTVGPKDGCRWPFKNGIAIYSSLQTIAIGDGSSILLLCTGKCLASLEECEVWNWNKEKGRKGVVSRYRYL